MLGYQVAVSHLNEQILKLYAMLHKEHVFMKTATTAVYLVIQSRHQLSELFLYEYILKELVLALKDSHTL